MTDIDEKLSFLLDDHPGAHAGANLDEVIADVNLQYRARRYHMIGEVMRHELPRAIDTGFHSNVMARIHDESPQQTATQAATESPATKASVLSWIKLKPFAGLAVAVSVAAVTVALWQPLKQGTGQNDDSLVSADQQKIEQLARQKIPGGVVTASTSLQSPGMRWKIERESPGLQQKLNAYLVTHTEYSNSMQSLIPQARVAGFDSQQ
ncbi:MAG: sigma-E factor negative regulatory protein [Gammaproteobacteria bacterium]|nr:sigma-E factor negative regulatory protein [Gammaproteobacteria bacterium]